MTEEYGPPIAVNGKRPDWLGDDDLCMINEAGDAGWLDPEKARHWYWEPITRIRLRADHPHYQSAEYKAASSFVGEDDRGYVYQGAPIADSVKAITAAVATLEAAGYTVTPPDPLVAEREFLAGFFLKYGFSGTAALLRDGQDDNRIPAAMDYLRQNKGRL